MIPLHAPLIVLDLETTGTAVEVDRIVQLGCIKIRPLPAEDGIGRELKVTEFEAKFNPEQPIPPEATAVHGITDEMVREAPPFREKAEQLAAYLRGCDYLGFNIASFDLRMLEVTGVDDFDPSELRRHGG